MKSDPLVFMFRDLIAGRGFVAAVETRGRVLLEHDLSDESWTMAGVNPGGMAGCAEGRQGAFQDFRLTYQRVLDDMVRDATSIDEFAAAVSAFVLETNDSTAAEWEDRRQHVIAGDLDLDIARFDAAGFSPFVSVRQVDQSGPSHDDPTPEMNATNVTFLKAA